MTTTRNLLLLPQNPSTQHLYYPDITREETKPLVIMSTEKQNNNNILFMDTKGTLWSNPTMLKSSCIPIFFQNHNKIRNGIIKIILLISPLMNLGIQKYTLLTSSTSLSMMMIQMIMSP